MLSGEENFSLISLLPEQAQGRLATIFGMRRVGFFWLFFLSPVTKVIGLFFGFFAVCVFMLLEDFG